MQVGDGVALNAAGTMTISAQAVRPNQLTIRDLNLRLPIGPSDNPPQPTIGGSAALDVAGSILTALQQWTNYQSDTFTQAPLYLFLLLWPLREAMGVVPAIKTTSTVAATGGGTRTGSDGTATGRTSFALTGSVIVLTLTNTASATVGQNARLNTAPDAGFAVTAAAGQRIDITANTSLDMVDFAGPAKPAKLSLFSPGANATGNIGVGGVYQQITVTTGADAHVGTGSTLTATDGVSVKAANRTVIVTDAQQGSDATKFAFAGAFTLLKLTSTALAYLQAGTTVTTAGDVLVDAANDLLAITVTAVQEKGGRVGIGAGVAVTTFSTTTRAFVGNLTSNPAGQAPLTPAANGVTARNLTVTATATSLLISLGAAGAEPGKPADSTSTKQNPSDSTAANTNTGSAMNQQTTAPQYGFGLSASVAVNFVADSTDAFVAIPGRVVLTGDLTIAALTTTTALALATALLTSNIGGPTLAGAFIWNEFSGQAFADPTTSDARRTTRAWLTAPLVQAVDVTVTSTTTERILSVSVGFGKIPPKKQGANGNPPTTINIAGAAAVNRLKTSTSAVIGARTVLQASGDVRLQATRTLLLVAITGGVALRGTAAVGASVAVTIADDLVHRRHPQRCDGDRGRKHRHRRERRAAGHLHRRRAGRVVGGPGAADQREPAAAHRHRPRLDRHRGGDHRRQEPGR